MDTLLFEDNLQSEGVYHRCEHPHIVAGDAVETYFRSGESAKNIPSAYDEGYFGTRVSGL